VTVSGYDAQVSGTIRLVKAGVNMRELVVNPFSLRLVQLRCVPLVVACVWPYPESCLCGPSGRLIS
jgi:hypothetical protein